MRGNLFIAMLLLAGGVKAQTVFTVTNNILNESHAALSGVAGTFRLNVEANDGVTAVNLTGTNVLNIYDATDYGFSPYTNSRLVGTVIGETTNGKVRFVIGSLNARSYILEGSSIQANPLLTFRFANHALTVTNTPATPISSALNIYQTFPITTQELAVVVSPGAYYSATGGQVVVLSSASVSTNASIWVKKIDANSFGAVIVQTSDGDLIDNAGTNTSLQFLNSSVQFQSDGDNWWIH